MKTGRQIYISVELNRELKELGLNVSEYCEEKLWDYVTQVKNKAINNTDKKEDLLNRKQLLEKELEEINKGDLEKEKMEKQKEEELKEKKEKKFLEIKGSLLDFYDITEIEAQTLTETYMKAKEENPDLDYWGYFNALNLPERPDDEVINEVMEAQKNED